MPRPKLADTEKLVSFPVRMTQRQMARLERIAVSDGLPVAEHMRRALDLYTEAREIEYNLPFLPLGTLPGSAVAPEAPTPAEDANPVPPAVSPPPAGHPMAGSGVDALLNDLGLGAGLPEIDSEKND